MWNTALAAPAGKTYGRGEIKMGFGGTVLATHKAERNGLEIEYNIEIASPSMKDEMVRHMMTEFLPREKMCSSVGLLNDAESLRCFERCWREIVDSETALVAILRKSEPKPVIIGMNMTYIWGSLNEKMEGEASIKVAVGMGDLRHKANLPERYEVENWLEAFGLSVGSKWHGFRIGERLLAAREPLCKLLGLPACFTVFTSEEAKHIAEKVGMETLAESDGGDLLVDGKKVFSPGLDGVIVKGMAKLY